MRARDAAAAAGALDLVASAEVNLASLHAMRGELDDARAHAGTARDLALRLGLGPLAAAAMAIDGAALGFAGQHQQMETRLRAAPQLSPHDADLASFAWGAGRGLCALVREDRPAAREAFARARRDDAPVGVLDTALAPLLLVDAVDGIASGEARAAAHAAATPGSGWSDLWLGYAEAVLRHAAREPDAAASFDRAEAAGRRHPLFRAIALRLAAEAAIRDGWGQPASWLRDAEATFVAGGQDRIAAACRDLLRATGQATSRRRGADRSLAAPLLMAGVTAREAEVLQLVGERMGNKEIAERLYLSPRTVEKHVASLLAKLGAHDRAALVRRASDLT